MLRQFKRLVDAFPIEWAEVRASLKQLAFQRLFFARRSDDGRKLNIFAALGANRSGKTIVAGWLCFAKYLREKARNGDVFWCVAVTLDRSVGGQQKELWNALPRWMFGSQQWRDKIGFAHRKIVLPTADGGTCLVEFRSGDQNPSTFEQAKLRGVWADECLPEEIFNRIIPRVIDLDGFILISDIPGVWWHHTRLIEAKPESGVHYQHMVMTDNAHNLPAGAIEQAAATMTEDEQQLRIHGKMIILEGIVYREYIDQDRDLGGHLVKRFPIPADWPKWRMIDYGASAPTAGLWAAIAPNEDAYLYREHYTRNLTVAENAKMILEASGEEVYRESLIDPHAFDRPPATYRAAKPIATQYAEAGLVATGWPYVQTMGEHAMVQRARMRYQNRKVWIFDDLINLRRENRSWKYKTDKEGKPLPGDQYENDNNHLLDCKKAFFATNPMFTPPLVKVIRG